MALSETPWAEGPRIVRGAADGRLLVDRGALVPRQLGGDPEQIQGALWSVDLDLRVTSARGRLLSDLGFAAGAILGRTAYDLLGTRDRTYEHVDAHQRALLGESVSYQTRILGRAFQIHLEPLRGEDGQVTGAFGVALDTTERIGVETRLRTSMELLRHASRRHRRLMARLVAAHEDERRSLSENLHDDTIQVISAVGMRLDALRGRIENEDVAIELDRLQSVVRNAVRRLRHLVFELRPPELDQVGLMAALRMYLHENAETEGPRYRLVDRLEHEPRGPTRLILYRFAQESLTNVRKHARAARVTVDVASTREGYALTIADDGVGCSPEAALRPRPGHLGLAAMRERAELSGGHLSVDSTPGQGTVVELRLPAD